MPGSGSKRIGLRLLAAERRGEKLRIDTRAELDLDLSDRLRGEVAFDGRGDTLRELLRLFARGVQGRRLDRRDLEENAVVLAGRSRAIGALRGGGDLRG